jgi:hypothetical protein
LDWLHQADPTSAHLSLNDLRLEPTIYLLPDYDTEEEARQHLQRQCKEIFEERKRLINPSSLPTERRDIVVS